VVSAEGAAREKARQDVCNLVMYRIGVLKEHGRITRSLALLMLKIVQFREDFQAAAFDHCGETEKQIEVEIDHANKNK
jgi:hypothetical protein